MYSLTDEFEYIIFKVLVFLGIKRNDNDDLDIMLGTCATETLMSRELRQLNYSMYSNEGAFGPWQQELKTSHDDIWQNYLPAHPKLTNKIKKLKIGCLSDKDNLTANFWYAAAMARMQYYRQKEALPKAGDYCSQAKYYKKYFNTYLGSGTEEKYIECYKQYILKYKDMIK